MEDLNWTSFINQIGPDWRSRQFETEYLSLPYEQQKRIQKLFTDQFYLIDVVEHDSLTYRISGSTRTCYTIKLLRDNRFHCDCPDFRSHARKHGVVCKHVIFLLFRVLKLVDWNFFRDNRLSVDSRERVHTRSLRFVNLHRSQLDVIQTSQVREVNDVISSFDSRSALTHKDNDIEFGIQKDIVEIDDCPICFDSMNPDAPTQLSIVGCPKCKNHVHKHCMMRWLLQATTKMCVYCRSPVWKYFDCLEV